MLNKSVQQFMLGTVMNNEKQVKETLRTIVEAGYEEIELCQFMINPPGLLVRILTRLAGMPIGKAKCLDWHKLIEDTGLKVTGIHYDLGSLEKDIVSVIKEAKRFKTKYIIVTGMYRFDYGDEEEMIKLSKRLNHVGKLLLQADVFLLYHNHNCELRKVGIDKTAYDVLLDETDPQYVNFEFDSYWFHEAGADPAFWMERIGERLRLWHINDRGSSVVGKSVTPIIKSDSKELGMGNMNLDKLFDIAESLKVESIILESHRNWIQNSPLKSLEVSARWLNNKIS